MSSLNPSTVPRGRSKASPSILTNQITSPSEPVWRKRPDGQQYGKNDHVLVHGHHDEFSFRSCDVSEASATLDGTMTMHKAPRIRCRPVLVTVVEGRVSSHV